MKTLNDKIICSFSVPATTTDETRTYTIRDLDGNTIFQGTVFVPKSDTSRNIEICLNDILKSEVERMTILDSYNTNEYNPIKSYRVYLSGITRAASVNDIFLGYNNLLHNYPVRCLLTSTQVSVVPAKKQLAPMLQGINNYSFAAIPSQKLDLYPRYPFVDTDQLNLSQLFNVGVDHDDIEYGMRDENDKIYICGAFSHNNYVDNFVCPLEDMMDSLPVIPGKKDIIVQSSALSETKITGKKLWRVEIEGQYLYEDEDVWRFLEDFGYPGLFYSENFYIQEYGDEIIPFITETNDPAKDIQGTFDSYPHLGGRCLMRYTEIQSAPNCILSYDPHNTGPISMNEYSAFNKFMARLSGGYITSALVFRWGIIPNIPMPDPVQLTFPFVVPDIRQLDIWKTYFEEFTDKDTYTYEDFFVYGSGEKGSVSGKSSTYKEEYLPVPIKIGEFDECPAKYYLQWIDRFKGVQCLPFKGKTLNTITYNTTNITNKYGEKRPAASENTFTFDLNTGWLSDKEYPLYEAIFVSPELKLYDVENDRAYKVIVTDKNFVEKTYKNLKKMFGFNIKLQINNTENILY